ncbi:MAG: TIGR03936 family radical SAM-associated protein [Armatimonadota bacterium]
MDRAYARVTFRKTGLLRFLGHLDVLRTFDRAVRRAKLPVEYSQGFSPHAHLSFAMPLPLGVAGERELCAIDLVSDWQPIAIMKGLARQLPPDLGIVEAQVLPRTKRSPFADLIAADYRAEIAGLEPQKLQEAVERLLQRDELMIHRTTKSRELDIDLRGRIKELRSEDNSLFMRLGLTDEDLAKPDEVLRLLTEETGPLQVQCLTRTALWDQGEL